MGNFLSQAYPGEAPKLTEKNLPNQAGKVFIVTGASGGVGKELAQILYSHDAKVYLATRSAEKTSKAIEKIKSNAPASKGELVYLHLELEDLTTVKKAAEEFLAKEDKLDVLWNNAAVMNTPKGSETKQGYELQLGVNNVAPFLFTKLLTPIMMKTAKKTHTGAVRVVWISSSAAEMMGPKGGLEMDKIDARKEETGWTQYGLSKAGNVLHANEYAKRYGKDGIFSVSVNPGNLRTDLNRHTAPILQKIFNFLFVYPPIFGGYTELFAGLSPDVTNASWVVPWGRIFPLRQDIRAAANTTEEGGTGQGLAFWEWTEEQVKQYICDRDRDLSSYVAGW